MAKKPVKKTKQSGVLSKAKDLKPVKKVVVKKVAKKPAPKKAPAKKNAKPAKKPVVKKVAKKTGDLQEFYRLLAEALPTQEERRRFLREVGAS